MEGNTYDNDWLGEALANYPPTAASADATATLHAAPIPDRTIGPAAVSPGVFDAPRGAATPLNPQPQNLPQGWQHIVRAIMGQQPGTRVGGAVGMVPVAGPALQGGFRAAQALDQGSPSGAGLAALGAVLGSLNPEDAEAGSAMQEVAQAAKTGRTAATPFGIHLAPDADHPTLAPTYRWTNPTTGEQNEAILASEDGGKTLRLNSIGPVRTNFQNPTDANTLGAKALSKVFGYIASMHPDADQIVGERGDGRIATWDLSRYRGRRPSAQ